MTALISFPFIISLFLFTQAVPWSWKLLRVLWRSGNDWSLGPHIAQVPLQRVPRGINGPKLQRRRMEGYSWGRHKDTISTKRNLETLRRRVEKVEEKKEQEGIRYFGSLCSVSWGRDRSERQKEMEKEDRVAKKQETKRWTKRWKDREGLSDWGRERVTELKRWLGCSLRGRIWLAMASKRATCCSKQPVDKCEIWFLSHLTAALHYRCTQITTAAPLHIPHEGTWRLTLLTGWTLHQWLVLTWHKTCAHWNGCTVVKMLITV